MTVHHTRLPVPRVPLTVAAWRLLRLGWLIGQGMFIVRRRFAPLDEGDRHAHVQRWAQRVLGVLGVEVSLHGQLCPGTRMLVANHVSWLDVMAVHSVCPQARFVAKADVRQWPAIGSLVAGAGSLFVDRHKPRLARRSVDQISTVMRAGGLVAVFAEGTTTNGRQVRPFRTGLLKAAVAAGCQVQPLALRYREGPQAVSDSVPYIDDDSLLQSLWRLCRCNGVQASLNLLAPRQAGCSVPRVLAGQLHRDVTAALGLPVASCDIG